MLYAREPTDEEQIELERMVHQEIGRVSRRAQMIRLSVRRKGVPQIADTFSVSKATVRFWIHKFDVGGPEALYDEPRSGRPPKITDDVKDDVIRLMQGDPQNAGYLATTWTVAMSVLALARTEIF